MPWHLGPLEIVAIISGSIALFVLLLSGVVWLRSRVRSRSTSPPDSALPLASARSLSALTPLSAPPLTAGTRFSYSSQVISPWSRPESETTQRNGTASRLSSNTAFRPNFAHIRRQASEGRLPSALDLSRGNVSSMGPPTKRETIPHPYSQVQEKPFVSYASGLRRLDLQRAGTDTTVPQLNGTANRGGLAVSPMPPGLGMDDAYTQSPLPPQTGSPSRRRTSYRSRLSPGRLSDHLGVESYFQLGVPSASQGRGFRSPMLDHMPLTAYTTSTSTALPSSTLSPRTGHFSARGSLEPPVRDSTSSVGATGVTPGKGGLRITLGTAFSELGDGRDEKGSVWLPSYYQPRLPSLRLEDGVRARNWGDELLETTSTVGGTGQEGHPG